MHAVPDVAAHLIVGAREEPFLSALLASLEPVVSVLIVNENSDGRGAANRAVLEQSAFARGGRLLVDRTPFRDFAAARNICLELHRRECPAAWAAFVDADEVHDAPAARIAANLPALSDGVDIVDGYTRHFFQSFDWYASIERRMSFFRVTPALRWQGAVHETLTGYRGGRLALPYVYAHYGHVLSVERHAEKESHYAELGHKGSRPTLEELHDTGAEAYFEKTWPVLLPFHGAHPAAARETIIAMRRADATQFAENNAIIRRSRGSLRAALERGYWRGNYELRWRSRVFDAAARRLMKTP